MNHIFSKIAVLNTMKKEVFSSFFNEEKRLWLHIIKQQGNTVEMSKFM